MVTMPSLMVVLMWRTAPMLAMASSIGRATSVSSCDGGAPGRLTATDTAGTSISGKPWMPRPRNATSPATVIMMNSSTEGVGFWIAQVERFTVWLPASRPALDRRH